MACPEEGGAEMFSVPPVSVVSSEVSKLGAEGTFSAGCPEKIFNGLMSRLCP